MHWEDWFLFVFKVIKTVAIMFVIGAVSTLLAKNTSTVGWNVDWLKDTNHLTAIYCAGLLWLYLDLPEKK